jgi:hypothetical protein
MKQPYFDTEQTGSQTPPASTFFAQVQQDAAAAQQADREYKHLWAQINQEAAQRKQQRQQMFAAASNGLTTSDQRIFQLSPDQIDWVQQKYKKSWTYGHDALDAAAKESGYMPQALASKYQTDKSAYDAWAVQMGMPSEKELEKYLTEYDEWKNQYAADEAAFNAAVENRRSQEALMESFFNDVADRLYKAEFKGVQRGSAEWDKVFFDAMNEPKYAGLKAYNVEAQDAASLAADTAEKKATSKKKKKDEEIEETPAGPLTQEQIDAIVAEKGYYFPEVPDLSFSFSDFKTLYDRNMTASETEHGYGKVNNAVRQGAAAIGYDKVTAGAVDTGSSSVWGSSSGGTHGGRSGSFGEDTDFSSGDGSALAAAAAAARRNKSRDAAGYKHANQVDTAAYCKDLALQGFNSEDFWAVMGGLTAGSPTSESQYGPGFYFDTATQEQIGRYGTVISTRFGSGMLNLITSNASDEEIQAFVAKAVNEGGTQELLLQAYNRSMAALGGGDEDDTSRNWDGLSYKERKEQDESFKKRLDAALQQAPSIPIGSGWTGKFKTKEEADAIVAKRAEFDLETAYKAGGYDKFSEKAQGEENERWRQLSPQERAKEAAAQHEEIRKHGMSGTTSVGEYAGKARFREDAKAHGYSDWEVDQFFRREGIYDLAPEETMEEHELRYAQHYREYLIEVATGTAGSKLDDEVPSVEKHSGHGGSYAVENAFDEEVPAVSTFSGHAGTYGYEDPAVAYFNSISDEDLVHMMRTDASVDYWKYGWTLSPAIMLLRGADTYAAGYINLYDMVAHGGDLNNGSSEVAEQINREVQELSAIYRRDNQSSFVATLTDAGSELIRMYLVAKTGSMFGEVVGGALGFVGAGGEAAAWLSSGTKAANLVKWGVESVPFITSAMGSSYAEARAEGATNQEAVQYGVLAGVVEGLTEKMGADIVFGKLGNAAVGKLMTTGAGKILGGVKGVVAVNLIKMAMNAASEATEEGTSYVLDLLLKKAIYNPDEKFSWKELGQQMGMGALCGAMGLAFQNYNASYVNSLMEYALSSPKNFQTFSNWAMHQYGANLGTNDNYVVKAEDFDPSKILPTSEFNEAWKNYLDASESLTAAQKQYETTVSSLDEDDAQKAREVMYWKNQVAAMDPNDAKSANAMVHAMEQLTLAESKAADTEKKNQKLRQDARTELNHARRRAQNTMDETSAKIRAHSRAEIAATLGGAGSELDSSYAMAAEDVEATAERGERAAALQAQLEETQAYAAAIDDAFNALQQLEQAAEAQKAAKAKLYDAAVSTLSQQYEGKPIVSGALETINQLAQAQETLAEGLEATAAEMSENLEAAKKEDQIRTANFAADLDSIDSWYGAEIDRIDAEMTDIERDARDGKITREEYEAAKEQAAERIQTAMSNRDAVREAAAVNFAADGGVSQSMEGLANAMRLEASEARAKAAEIRDAVVRALAFRTQEAAFAAIDSITTGEGVLTVEQREALQDEMNQLIAEQLMNDEATKAVYDAMEGLKLLEQQAEQKTSKAETAPQENASEAQEGTEQAEQETTPKTSEERQAELQKAVAVGKALGVDVKIVDNLPKELNGKYYDDGRILISSKATNAPMQVLVHELAHYIEGTAAYDQLQQYVFGVMAQDPDFNLNVEIAAYRTLYANSRDAMGEAQLSDAEAIQEAKAEIVSRWCEKNLFTNEDSINKLCASETSLGKRILNGIQNLLSGKRSDPALKQLQTAEKLYIKALHQARAFGGAKINRSSVASLLVGAGLYIDSDADGFKVYRTRYNENGDRMSIEELKPNLESPCDGPITTDDIMNHSPIGAFIRLGQAHGNIAGFNDYELEPGTNLRAIPSEKQSTGAKIINLFTDLSNMCLAYGDNGMVWDFVGGYVFSCITSNSDPQYSRTVDFGTICRKTQNLITAMSEAMVQKGRGLYPEEIIELSNELVAAGKLDVPCSMCYVFNRWLGLGGYLNRAKVYQDRYSAMTPDEAFKAFQEVQAQLDEVVDSRNFKTLINDLCAKHGIDPKAYLDELAASNKSFKETGKFQATKKTMSKSDARARAIQLYAKLLDDCQQSHDRKSLKDVNTTELMKDLETRMGVTDAYGWFTKVLLNENEDGTFSLKRSVLSEDGKSWALGKDGNATFVVPVEILFNMNASDRFATEYPDVWRFRTSGGSALGKATYGYTDARLGEFTAGAAVSNVKSQDVPKASRFGIGSETLTAENQPKNKLSFVDSRGEFASGGAATFAKAVQNILNQAWLGGDRMQSSSDYTSNHALDYLITAFEMQCLGAPVQVYSKVPEGLSFFDAIGAGANASLIAKGGGIKGTPVYEFNAESGHYRVVEGSATLDISKVQGIDPDVARAMIEASDNIQGIMVGMNREHTALTISTPWITMCIPVHMSGSTVDNISARAVAQGDPGLTKADVNDATGCQNDKLLTEKELASTYKDNVDMVRLAREQRAAILSKNGNADLNKIHMVDDWIAGLKDAKGKDRFPGKHRLLENMYNAFQKSGAQLKVEFNEDGTTPKGLGFGIYPNEYWDTTSTIDNAYVNGDRFLEYCYMLGVKPRFSYGEYGKHGSFPGLHKFEGYWKVLIDRPMYNRDGSYRAVRPVDVSKLTAAMLNGTALTPLGERLGVDENGKPKPGATMYNAEESTKMQRDEATAARVGREYSEGLTGTPEDAMRKHSRNALAGDIDAQLAELRKQFGAMPTSGAETAPGRENVVLPRQTNEDTYVRRAAQTFMRSPNVTDAAASDIGRAVLRGEFNYERQTNEETESKATRMMQDLGGQEAALKHLEDVARGTAKPGAELVALGEQLILDAQAVGDVNAFERAVVYTAMLGTAAGQTVQAFSMINKLSPQGIALYMNKVIERLNNVEYRKLIAQGKMKPIQLTEDQVARIMNVKSFSEARQVETKILEEIGTQIPLTLKEQLRSWRYLCMLGNVRTNVRNLAGNVAMASMQMSKNTIAAGLEAWDVKRGAKLAQKAAAAARTGDTAKAERLSERAERHLTQSDRTKALRFGSNADLYKTNLAYAKGTTADAIELLKGGGKDVGLSALQSGKRMFNNKFLNKVGKAAMRPLDVGDLWFSKPHYEHAYAQWMTAKGLTGEDMTLKQRNEAMKYAVNEAQKATFRDANWLATKITEIRNKNLFLEVTLGGVMPFAKTPANILRRGIEYSPAGLIQGISQLVKANNATDLSHSERMQMRAAAIDRMASGVSGTGLMAIGMLLRSLGVFRGKDDDDKIAAKFGKDMGRQAYSTKLPLVSAITGKDVSMTLDWLAPLNMPMFMGAAIWDTAEKLSEGEELNLKDIADPILSIANPLIEMSMLSGIQSAFKTYGDENTLSAVGRNALQSFTGQFIPTIGGQLARTIDLTRRSPDSKHYWIQSMAAKIPGLSKTVKPYVGGYGEEEEFDPTDSTFMNYLLRAFEQFFMPGYIKAERNDELTKELFRLYESTGVNNYLPQRPSDYKKLNLGKQYGTWDLTYDEQVEYEKLFRSEAAKALSEAIKMPAYKGLSDADKADLLTEVYQQATKNARAQMKQTIMKRYNVGGIAATRNP